MNGKKNFSAIFKMTLFNIKRVDLHEMKNTQFKHTGVCI